MPSISAAFFTHAIRLETRFALPGAGSSDSPPSAPARGPGAAAAPPTGALAPRGETPGGFARVLQGLGREVQRGETLMRRAMTRGMHIGAGTGLGAGAAGSSLDPAELIALQAGVYHYAEAIDLSSRLVDRASSSVKTILQG